ncbi:cytochrome P450 [Nocardia thailandica]
MTTSLPLPDLFDPAVLEDPYPLYARLREHAPVHRVPGTDFHLVSSWAAVSEAADRTAEFSSHLTAVLVDRPGDTPAVFDLDSTGTAVHVLATADARTHAAHRGIVGPALAARVRAVAPRVRALAETLWDTARTGDRLDWATGMADRLPFAVLAEIIGLPARDVPRLLTWAYDSTEMLGGVVAEGRMPALVASAAALAHYAWQAVAGPDIPAGSLLGVLAAARAEGRVDEQQAVLILVQLVGAGGESTAGLIASAARLLATHPEIQDRVRARPELLPLVLDEAMRLESPFRGHHRHVTADTSLAGTDLPAGSHLLLLWGAANRDPAVFPDPDTFDPARPRTRAGLAFGRGAHFCLGSALARAEATAALTLLLERTTTFALDPDTPPRWVPSLFVRRHASLPLRLR